MLCEVFVIYSAGVVGLFDTNAISRELRNG